MLPAAVTRSSRISRHIKAVIVALLALSLLAGALSIPFVFESPTSLYKFGFDKTLLRAGQLLGMTAATLLLFQLLFSARIKFLDRIFSLPRLYALHGLNGLVIALLVLLHPILIYLPEGFSLPPVKLEYWPEAAGFVLMLLICLQAGISRWRKRLPVSFERWRQYHRYTGGLIILLVLLHTLFVAETFEAGLPRYALLFTTAVFIVVFLAARFNAGQAAKKRCRIQRIRKENSAVVTLELDAGPQAGFAYLPGQFAFITVHSDRISPEPHPFTISSTPSQPDRLTFTIKASGDWTSALQAIEPGARVSLHGPFGRFSHLICPDRQPLVLIAGGIGITPMLSMLRYMHDVDDQRPVLLIWSNAAVRDKICQAELDHIQQGLSGLTQVHTFTREKSEGRPYGRLDRPNLREFLKEADRSAAVFICGPPLMMAQVARDVRTLGFKRRDIHTERFDL